MNLSDKIWTPLAGRKRKQWFLWQTSLVMLPWRRVSICNLDNSWGMKALRRGRVTSGIQIADNSNQSKSNFLNCYQDWIRTKQNWIVSPSYCIPVMGKTTVATCRHIKQYKPDKRHTFTFNSKCIKTSSLSKCRLANVNSSNVWPRFKGEQLQGHTHIL